MSFFSSPAAVGAKPEPQPDPAIEAQREAIAATNRAEAEKKALKARADYAGKTMGTQGANAMFTNNAAGYGRTMGAANV